MISVPKKWLKDGNPGTINFPQATIQLDTALSDDRIVEVILHEIIESIKDRFTLTGLSHEATCALEFGIMDTLRNNKYLMEALKAIPKGNTYVSNDFISISDRVKKDIGVFINEEEKFEGLKKALAKKKTKTQSRKNTKKQEN